LLRNAALGFRLQHALHNTLVEYNGRLRIVLMDRRLLIRIHSALRLQLLGTMRFSCLQHLHNILSYCQNVRLKVIFKANMSHDFRELVSNTEAAQDRSAGKA
jgi:hypothetical protein